MYAEKRDLSFGKIHREVICIFGHLVKREFTDDIGHRSITNDAVRFQLDGRIVEEL